MIARHAHTRPRGISLVEVLIVVAIVLVVVMMLAMAIPRSREKSRLVSCSNHLGKIGGALGVYDNAFGHLPSMPGPGERGPGPLAILGGHVGFGDFGGESGLSGKLTPLFPGVPAGRPVRGFVCPADSDYARAVPFPAATSYRACTGPGPGGVGGVFPLGGTVSTEAVEKAAGKDFTAAFAERRLGSGSGDFSPANDYRLVPGPIGPDGCPESPAESWRGDAGSSWESADWKSTLYNHAMPPNGSPSCVSSDGRSARMGASSNHANRVNVLMVGGSVRGFTTSVDPEVWRKFGGVSVKERAGR